MGGLLLLALLASATASTRGERIDARCRSDRRISATGLCGESATTPELPPLPTGPIVALLANNIDGSNNTTLANGALIPTWKNLGSATVADFVQATDDQKPSMRKAGEEQASTFDGVFDLMTSPGSKTSLNFIHKTGVFDVILVVRRTNNSVSNERRLFGGCEGQAGLAVLLLTPSATEGAIWIILGGGAGLITNFQTTIVTPLGTPYKVLVRGDGTQTRVSHDFSTFQSQAFAAALGTTDSFYDYSIGAANPSQTTPLTFAGEIFDVLVYDRNLSPAELTQVTTFLDAQIGPGT